MSDSDPTPKEVNEILANIAKFMAATDPALVAQYAQLAARLRKQHDQTFDKFKIAIINALPQELAAVEGVFGEPQYMPYDVEESITYVEVTRKSGQVAHVVIAGISGQGLVQAASAVGMLTQKLPFVRKIVLVGIGAGQPDMASAERDVCLGDIVVSEAVVQYDHVKREEAKDPECRGTNIAVPDAQFVNTAKRLKSTIESAPPQPGSWRWEQHIGEGLKTLSDTYGRPDSKLDPMDGKRTYNKAGPHKRFPGRPHVHLGVIGSASTLLKDAKYRDNVNRSHKTIAYEMEGAGAAIAAASYSKGYIIVRGICDYADMNKDDIWQRYASVAAASFAKALIEEG